MLLCLSAPTVIWQRSLYEFETLKLISEYGVNSFPNRMYNVVTTEKQKCSLEGYQELCII